MRLSVLAVPILVLPGLLLLIASLVKPLFVDRYVVYSNIGIALLLGALMDYFHRRQRSSRITWIAAVAVLAALVPPSLSLRTPQSRSDNVTAIGATVRKEGRPGDGLLYLSGRHRILTAANPEDTRFLTDLALAQDPVSSNTLAGVELPAQEIAARMLEFDRIVAVRAAGAHSPANPQEEAKTSTLRRHFREYGTTHVNGARVTVYVRDHDPSPKAGPGSTSPVARNRPLTDDLHRRQPPPTSTSRTSPTHATPVTCTFKTNTTQCVSTRERREVCTPSGLGDTPFPGAVAEPLCGLQSSA
ncbi:hypothetical protein [Streptomyces albicerus]|uniref:hypothetical protein n=1 Tax=Streptomyces albicerus TaxID=2569859 RepID=UPI001CED2C00|nr:hypothetical protein [Streptomyces albicerus]